MPRSALHLLPAALLAAAGTAQAGPRFVDRAPEQGWSHVYSGGWEHFVGGGVAVLDCDGDLRPDLYAAGGEAPASLLVNVSEVPGGPLRFERRRAAETDLTGATGAYPLDVDGDGRLDLYVMRAGPDALLRGLGGCRFEDATARLGLDPGARWTTAFSAAWEGDAALPTLAVGHYVDRDDPKGPFRACDDHALLRPEGDRYGPPIPLRPGYCALSMLISDWGRTGHRDLRISNDRHYYVRGGSEQLFRLTDPPEPYDEAEGWRAISIWGMGIASRDLDGDGRPEIHLTSMGDQKLLELETGDGRPTYALAPYDRGITAHRPHVGGDGRPSSGWHAEFGDVDDDGLDDLFVAKGNVDQMPDMAMEDPDNLLMQRPDGRFEERSVEAGIASTARGRGAALVDLNLDGRLDIVVVNRRAPLLLWENVTEGAGSWIALRPLQDGPNRNAVGAWIELRAGGRVRAREVTVGGGHAGGQAGFAHFGLGEAESAEVRVIWPDGAASDWQAVEAGRFLALRRGSGGGLEVGEATPE